MRFFNFVVILCCAGSARGSAIAPDLGSAGSFAVLGGAGVTNTGGSLVNGSLGSGTSVTGFPPGTVVNGSIRTADAVTAQAFSDLGNAYNFAAGEACGDVLTGQDLGGKTITPGVHCFSSSAQLTGRVTLDGLGNPAAVWVFQIGSTLNTSVGAAVLFAGGGQGGNVFWQVGSSATLGTGTEFAGNILALTSVSLNNGSSLGCGRALASNAAVTLDTNSVSRAGCEVVGAVPEPVSGWLVAGLTAVWMGIHTWKYAGGRARTGDDSEGDSGAIRAGA